MFMQGTEPKNPLTMFKRFYQPRHPYEAIN